MPDNFKPKVMIEIAPHPRFKGDWLVRCERLLPWPVWFKSRDQAISYANWLGSGYDFELRCSERL